MNEKQPFNPFNPFDRPGGHSDPPTDYWYSKPYGECAWIPGTNCPKDQVFAGIARHDCNEGDAKTLCAEQWWENLATNHEFRQFECSAVTQLPCALGNPEPCRNQ
jgi:hypothetical protein